MSLSYLGQGVGAANAVGQSAPKATPVGVKKASAPVSNAASGGAKSVPFDASAVPPGPKDLPRGAKLGTVKDSLVQDQQKIPFVSWVDSSQPVDAVILCVHGLGLHKGTYEAFGKKMSKIGVPTYALDVRGFGEWKDDYRTGIDFEGALADIKIILQSIKKNYPNKPVVILGESMGGAIALRATAMYPELISGLVSSVPSGDRFGAGDTKLKVGLHGFFHGFNKPMNIGTDVVGKATQKEDLRETWSNDKLGRMNMTPKELMQFQSFMEKNFLVAKEIKTAPVLFIQGANDKLVRPAGTWKLFDNLTTDKRQLVFSKNAEHLIFEEGQFSDEDISFVEKWINKNVAPLTTVAIATDKSQPAVATNNGDGTEPASSDPKVADATSTSKSFDPTKTDTTAPTVQQHRMATATQQVAYALGKQDSQNIAFSQQPGGTRTADFSGDPARISYWIELARNGKVYRCNNKTSFKSGDAIKFHIIPQTDGYAYVVMNKSSRGKSATLFPSAETGTNNFLTKGEDYPLPSKTWLKFDEHPGTEKVSLVFSQKKIEPRKELQEQRYLTAYVSPSETGSKDLVPTRMQLSWDDPTPVIIPSDFSGNSQLASASSLVKVSFNGPGGVLSVDIALAHQ
jgi:alpha-beta hydrolase superfamily lysophospholipase